MALDDVLVVVGVLVLAVLVARLVLGVLRRLAPLLLLGAVVVAAVLVLM
ncbi:hypothetical protein JQS43_24425 [Natronosporangium hydrolyticum]|uniref:Uncharacterized protein n=1 Tax=Natronosporangium hydrolyticum TaxID=2811111 RepID=A0A895YAZ8_9ACTN|nr:hypothetical protein [Natronosporangium hydrolyticum]QSB14581.1 hypothetical protein JQS43_24425 [Natronosporangium hydrolyticum]